jgi:hypothetical protein
MSEKAELIEIVVKNHVAGRLDCPVYMEFPERDAPEYFVILDRTDSNRENHIDAAMFVVQSYAPSKLAAAMLNAKAKAAMDSLIELDMISACNLSGDYPFPDTKRKRHRYQAVYDITHY